MVRYFLAMAAAITFASASVSSQAAPSQAAPSEAAPSSAGTLDIPPVITFPSSVGEVIFPHQMHISTLGIKCIECHHQISAKTLVTPHPDYLKSSWINCAICHNSKLEKITPKAYTCSECHHSNPTNIADETLSAKVVIHERCWSCHPVGVGKEASKNCQLCHSGKRT
jgi:hypothetical protein